MDQVKKWTAGTVGLSLLILVGAWFLLLSPERSSTAALKQKTVTQDQQNDATRADIDVLRKMAVGLDGQRAIIARFGERVPATADLPQLVRTLSAEAKKAGITITTLTPTTPSPLSGGTSVPAADSSGLQQVNLSLSITGAYFNVERFLAALEEEDRVFLVTSLDVSPGDAASADAGKSADPALTATINGRVFMTAPAAAAAPANGAVTGGSTTTAAGAAPAASVN